MQTSVSINDYEYANNLISATKEAKVYKAIHSFNPDLPPLIFKGYPESYLSDPLKEKKLIRQLNFLWKLRGKPNIVQILSQHYRDRMIFIITEFCECGDLASQINKKGPFPEEKAIAYIKQIINGYSFISDAKLIHRNLEPSNIMISAQLEVKIGNFGQAIHRRDAIMAMKKEEMVGTHSYQAPEVLEAYAYSERADIYSIALIFLFMLKGKSSFVGANKFEILSQMKQTPVSNLIGNDFSLKVKHFIMKCLNQDPEKRMSAQQMLSYEFDVAPKLTLNKFFTFQDNPERRSRRGSQRMNSQLQRIEEIFEDVSPIRLAPKKSSNIDLKASYEMQLSAAPHDKEVSIFIPSKLDIPTKFKERSKKDFFKLFAVQSNIELEYEPSLLILPTEKDASARSQTSKSRRSSIDQAIYHQTTSQNSGGQAKLKVSKRRSLIPPTLSFTPSNNGLRNRFSAPQGDSSAKQPAIEVVVHSPKRPPKSSKSLRQNNVYDEEVIANWLLSQIDFMRYLSRTCYRLKKLEPFIDRRLIEGLQALRTQIITQTKTLEKLDSSLAGLFKDSLSFQQIIEIIQSYEDSCKEQLKEQQLDRLQKLLADETIQLFCKVREQSILKPEQIKALDHMAHCLRLVKLYAGGNLQYFYEQSSLESLIHGEQKSINISRVLDIQESLKQLRLLHV